MGALERLDKLPDWPARMTAPVAAAYMGVSQNTFTARFGQYGRKEGGNVLWLKAQLDLLNARQFGIDLGGPAPTHDSVEDEIAAWKAGRGRK